MKNKEDILDVNEAVEEEMENLASDKNQHSQSTITTKKSDRVGRERFFVWSCHFLPMFILLSFVSSLAYEEVKTATDVGYATDTQIVCTILLHSLFVAVTLFYVWAVVKRLHDMNMSGWWCLLNFLQGHVFLLCIGDHSLHDMYWNDLYELFLCSPYFWLIFPFFNIFLCCVKGTNGINKYGEAPA